jgi:hypothetical protein
MKNLNDISEIRKQVDMFFDHALSRDDEQTLLSRVNHDPAYHRVFNQEKNMRDKIKKHVHRPGVSPDLIQVIKEKIRMA